MDTQHRSRIRCLLTATAVATLLLSNTALAQVPFDDFYNLICLGPAEGPVLANIDGDAKLEILRPNITSTILQDVDTDNLAEADLEVSVKALEQNGNEKWNRKSLTIKTNDVAMANPFFGAVLVGVTYQPPDQMLGLLGFNTECLGLGVAEVGNKKYVMVSLGIAAVEGMGTTYEDFTKINVWILDAATGAVVHKHTIRPRTNRMWVDFSSGVFDVDGDGDDELVSIYAKLTSEEQIEWKALVFNLLTGQKKSESVVFQNVKFENLN